jgi:hypothetical protein
VLRIKNRGAKKAGTKNKGRAGYESKRWRMKKEKEEKLFSFFPLGPNAYATNLTMLSPLYWEI